MPNSDRMLQAVDALSRGLVPYEGGYIGVDDLLGVAHRLQECAMRHKLTGNHQCAVALYRQLLPIVRQLDELQVLPGPVGLASQIAQRAVEIEEEQLLALSPDGSHDSAN